jgi:hypothetical protein
MKKIAIMIAASAATLALQFYAGPAQTAAISRTFVSVSGSDSNPCTETSPCQTLGGALANTTDGGVIQCLDSGYFPSAGVAITISVTIDCFGTNASTFNTITGDGIDIDAPGKTAILRGLIIAATGNGTGTDLGVNITAAQLVSIEDCVVTGTWVLGINDARISGPGQLVVKNTVVRQSNPCTTSAGISIVPGSGVTIDASISGSLIEDNSFGIIGDGRAGGSINAVISNSVVSGNTEDGIAAVSSGSDVWFLVDQTEVSGNAYGLAAGGSGAEILASNSSVFGNTTGLHTGNGGALYSYGNNRINGNTTNGTFTGTIGLQ